MIEFIRLILLDVIIIFRWLMYIYFDMWVLLVIINEEWSELFRESGQVGQGVTMEMVGSHHSRTVENTVE